MRVLTSLPIRILRSNGFEIDELIEIRPQEGMTSNYAFVSAEWARRWPCEEAWRARRR